MVRDGAEASHHEGSDTLSENLTMENVGKDTIDNDCP